MVCIFSFLSVPSKRVLGHYGRADHLRPRTSTAGLTYSSSSVGCRASVGIIASASHHGRVMGRVLVFSLRDGAGSSVFPTLVPVSASDEEHGSAVNSGTAHNSDADSD